MFEYLAAPTLNRLMEKDRLEYINMRPTSYYVYKENNDDEVIALLGEPESAVRYLSHDEGFYDNLSAPNIDLNSEFLYARLYQMTKLPLDWAGKGAEPISETVYENAVNFLRKIPSEFRDMLSSDSITITPYGTAVIDWEANDKLVSVEIGKSRIGYFAENVEGFTKDDISLSDIGYPFKIFHALEQFQLISAA